MKQIAIVSGKGGTGKTTIAASFAALAGSAVIADCDVDAATLHLILNPMVVSQQEFKGSKLASIDKRKCLECGLCQKNCRYFAIRNLEIDPILCEGCGVCTLICPGDAISLSERVSGEAYISRTRFGPMSHAKLNAAAENSGKLVTLVRQNAMQLAEKENLNLIIIDGPPGIGCPVIASLTGIDLVLVVTEPTLSGLHDLERMLGVVHHFGLLPRVIINMYDINSENAEKIAESCRKNYAKVIAMVPFDQMVIEAMVAGRSVIEYSPQCIASMEIRKAWEEIQSILGIGTTGASDKAPLWEI
ncbi:MAG: ATP-binding protein [Thermoproteota archaeon]